MKHKFEPYFPLWWAMHLCILFCSILFLSFIYMLTIPDGASGKEPTCQCRRRRFDPWVGKIPWSRKWQPTPVFLPEESHRQRSLGGHSPWGHKESDTTEVTWHAHTVHLHCCINYCCTAEWFCYTNACCFLIYFSIAVYPRILPLIFVNTQIFIFLSLSL